MAINTNSPQIAGYGAPWMACKKYMESYPARTSPTPQNTDDSDASDADTTESTTIATHFAEQIVNHLAPEQFRCLLAQLAMRADALPCIDNDISAADEP